MKYLCFIIYVIELSHCTIKVRDTENNITMGVFPDVESNFGGTFIEGTKAYIIESNPILACNETIAPPPIYLPNGSDIIFVSLIGRGICTFGHKVRTAQKSGYHGVIVFNNESDSIFPMQKQDYSDDHIHIPSRLVGRTSGELLKKFTFTFQRQQYIVIFFDDFNFNPQYYIIAFLGFVSLGFVIIGVGFVIKLCLDWCKRRANRLKKSHLKKIPVRKFIKGKDSFDTCAICLDDFMDGDKLRILPCNHAYHIKCIDPWLLKQRRNCPICKSRIKIPGRDEESDESEGTVGTPALINAIVNEHTPLIDSRNCEECQSYLSNNESDVILVSDHGISVSPNGYENPCIDRSGSSTPNECSVTAIVPNMSVNNTDLEVTVVVRNGGDTSAVSPEIHQIKDLAEIV